MTVSPELDAGVVFARRDVRELLVHTAPLHNAKRRLGPVEWHTILAVGAGLSNASATRVSDVETKIVGTLRDHPSLRCHFDMRHDNDDTPLAAFIDSEERTEFRIHRLVIAQES